MADSSVLVAYVTEDEPTGSFRGSYLDLLGHDLANNQRFVHNGEIGQTCGTDGIAGARNNVVRKFLKTDASWLFWLDDDMGFAPDTVDRLLEVADPDSRPIVGALCFAMRQPVRDTMHGWRTVPIPVIYDWAKDATDDFGFDARRHYPRNAVVQCSATGSACILIHRSVFEKVAAEYLPQGQAWYDRAKLRPETLDDGAVVIAEDLSFCMRAASVGCPTFVHTGVKTTHEKKVWLGEDRYLAETWPLPATDPVAVIVPVLSRPQNVRPFMESLRASTGLATAYFVCDPHDTVEQDAVRANGGTVLTHDSPYTTFSVKANYGYRNTSEPWLLFVGDDVMFRPGWYDRAIRAAGDRFHLVACEDLSSLNRLHGHAVHPLVRRVWIDEHGASWDGPGTVAHEGYRHNFVDNEWSVVARQAGVFIDAPDAVVEHLHPLFKKAESDAIYEKGQFSYERDKRLFEKRLKENSSPTTSGFSTAASVAAYDRQWRTIPGLVKVQEDLDRYERIIETTKPEVVVECGTWSGMSAAWFAFHGADVITIDVEDNRTVRPDDRVTFLQGSSTDPDVVAKVAELVAGRRCMVVLDSDHSATHVAAEMEAYAPLVSPGCYMVVEDGICRWVPDTPVTEFGPLDAIESFLPRPGWEHDDDLLNLYPVSHHPGGWLRRAG